MVNVQGAFSHFVTGSYSVLQLSENFSLEGLGQVCYLQVIQGEVGLS